VLLVMECKEEWDKCQKWRARKVEKKFVEKRSCYRRDQNQLDLEMEVRCSLMNYA
jgi:hypothetical protein